jgi:aerobic carbon-monoxide dehydrogenase medium subunit
MSWVKRYLRAESLDEAAGLLTDPGLRLLGGGSRLIPARPAGVDGLVDLGRPPLDRIIQDGEVLRLEARVRLSQLTEIDNFQGLLGKAAISLGHSPNLRNQMTVGGECAWVSPGSELQVALLALGASVVFHGPPPSPLVDYLSAPERRGIITALEIPLQDDCRYRFDQVTAAKGAAPQLTMAAMARLGRGRIEEIRLAFGNLGTLPLRTTALERELTGTVPAVLHLTDTHTAGLELLLDSATDKPGTSPAAGRKVKLAWVETLTNRFLRSLRQGVTQ